ncbi:MAG: flagellar protein FlaG [Alphaproteobacteria bacterium]|nr:flagellar protein FlaG [Alphaproteobacteria bacterium]
MITPVASNVSVALIEPVAPEAARPVSRSISPASVQQPRPNDDSGARQQEAEEKRDEKNSEDLSTALGERYRQFKDSLLNLNSRLSIDQDEATDRYVYRSIHRKTGEVLNQWPAEEILHMLKALREQEAHLVDKTV